MPPSKRPATMTGKNVSQRLRPYAIFIGLIIILPLTLFWRWVSLGEVLFWGTPLYQFWPWHQLVKTTALAGEWPLWNPLLGNGTPLLANLQTAFFYPPNLLYFFIPVEHGLTLSVVLHLIMAGFLMFVYARAIGLTPFAATIAATTYMFSGYVIGRVQFVTMVNALAWFPLLLLLVERMVTRRRYQDALWLGLALAGQLLAGHAQLWFYGLWLIGAYAVFRSWQETTHRADILITLRQLGLALGLSVLLAAGQILPTTEFVWQSPRDSGIEQYFALTYSFWPWRLITLVAPDFFGNPAHGNYWGYANYWEDHAYIGVLPLLLAFITMWRFRPRRHRPDSAGPIPPYQRVAPFFMALIPLSLILAMGWNTPVYLWVFEFVPGFQFFQAPARLLIGYTMAITVLAGIGGQIFSLTPHNRPTWRRLLIAGVGLTVAGIAGRLVLAGKNLTFVNATITAGILLTLAIILLLTYPATTRRKTVWQVVVIIFIVIDLLWFAAPLILTLPATVYTTPMTTAIPLQTNKGRFMVDHDLDYALKFQGYFRFDTFGPLNPAHWQNFKNTLAPNIGVYAGLPAANNDDPLVVERWQTLTKLVQKADTEQKEKLLSLMNVAFFIDDPTQAVWPVIYQDEAISIQQLPNPLPRAYFVAQAQWVDTAVEVQEKLMSPQFDPYHEVIIMKAGQNLTFPNQNLMVTDLVAVTIAEQSPHQLGLTVHAPSAGFVVLTDTYYPGWQATVDGQPAPIWPANLAFRAVAVDAGPHQLEFSYRPRSFILGLWISLITLIAVLAILTGTIIRAKNRGGT